MKYIKLNWTIFIFAPSEYTCHISTNMDENISKEEGTHAQILSGKKMH